LPAATYWNSVSLSRLQFGSDALQAAAHSSSRRAKAPPDPPRHMTMLPLFRRLLPRLLHPRALRPAPVSAAACSRHVRAFASGGMFESLTSSMGATFKKLLGRKTLTREEVDSALASVHDALVDADVAQVGTGVGFRV